MRSFFLIRLNRAALAHILLDLKKQGSKPPHVYDKEERAKRDCALTPTARDKVTDCNLFQVMPRYGVQHRAKTHGEWRQ